ncbi:MAG: tRNA dihydrouridine synthase DusB [Clostridiales bacterium]|nr:tRNA dihydrouridine synthase DusB [Clostridiales bacterium]
MKISHIALENDVFAAPLAGFSNRAFREILRGQGAGLAYGEMVSAQALCHGNKRTLELLDIDGEAGPHVAQLFGSRADYMAEAARMLRDMGADIIDINMGCPMPKVVNNGEGAALLRRPLVAASLVEAVAAAGLPTTVKMRIGWDELDTNAPELARRLEAAGASLLAVHGRYREQYYRGQADWTQIAAVKKAVSIPVAANGDIWEAADALAIRRHSGCDAVMVGRGMLGNPWLMAEITALSRGEPLPNRPSARQVLATALAHVRRHVERSVYWHDRHKRDNAAESALAGELAAIRAMRGHLGYYVKGMPGAAQLRAQINRLTRIEEIERLFAAYLAANANEQM